jgi:beta-ribofuranosylaminobenzene 5'-phosphate synthase
MRYRGPPVTRIVHVSTPSRLHFGLLRLHESSDRSFGGFGMMIDRPRVELTIAPAHDWSVSGIATNREISFAQKVVQSLSPPEPIRALAIHVESVVPQHRGLGGGTQLALAIAAGVRELFELPPATADELADSVGRGLRSAIGTHGFLRGGLIWERGRAPGERLAPLTARVALPAAWRVVLIAPSRAVGLHGPPESVAFEKLPTVSAAVTRQLETIAEDEALPAAQIGDLESFGDAVYRYGRLAGGCFAPVQGGPYASAEIAHCVSTLRKLGIQGVGQSSWGPSVFALTPGVEAAQDLIARWTQVRDVDQADITVAGPDNHGVVVSFRVPGAHGKAT